MSDPDELLDPYGPHFYLNAPPGYYSPDPTLVDRYFRRCVFVKAVEQADQKRTERRAAVDKYLEVRRRDGGRTDQP